MFSVVNMFIYALIFGLLTGHAMSACHNVTVPKSNNVGIVMCCDKNVTLIEHGRVVGVLSSSPFCPNMTELASDCKRIEKPILMTVVALTLHQMYRLLA